MKSHIHLALVSLLSAALCCTALAGVPLSWSVDVTRVEPVRLDAYHGETLDLSAKLMQGRASLAVPAGAASFLWQTNGMGAAWWQTNATVSADGVVRGTFGPPMDTGADAVRFFFSVVSGSGANYRAAGTIALRPSPGASPTTADLAPQTTINFADYQLVNAPWVTSADTAESVRAATNALATVMQASDNALASAISDAARAATNYADSVASAGNSALVAATNALAAGESQLVATAAQAASNYTDAAVASIELPSLSGYATESWVTNRGYLTEHQSLSGYATEAWVQGRNYLTEHQSLTGYATEEWARHAISNALPVVPSLDGYATESWVTNRGYLTEHQSLSGYATEAWVQGRGYLTEHQPLAGYATEEWTRQLLTNATPAVPSLDGYATQEWVTDRNYLTEHQSLAGFATEAYVSDAATGARESAEAYARSLAWGSSAGNTRLVTLDGSTWQDATGTVWQVSGIYGWSGTVIDLSTSAASPIKFSYAGKTDHPHAAGEDYWSAGAGTNLFFGTNMGYAWTLWFTNTYHDAASNSLWFAAGDPPISATNITINTSNEFYNLFYRPVALSTNPVDHVLYASDAGDAATAERALTYGTPTRWTDATGCVWEVGYRYDDDWVADSSRVTQVSWSSAGYEEDPDLWAIYFTVDGSIQAQVYEDPPGTTQTNLTISASSWETLYEGAFDFNIYRSPHTTTNLVGRVALTNDLPDTASITNDLADLRTESALVYRLYSGSNVVAEVTNYNSQVHAPSLRLLQLNESNEYITVWTETNGLARTLAAATNYTDEAISSRAAPRAWSGTTSGLGAEAPSNTTWISTPTTVIAGGFEYAKFVDTYGEVWVLTSNGMAAEFNPETNAYFRITADDGTPVFSIEKSDAQVVGANASGITVGESSITIPVPVVSSTAPTMYWRQNLDSGVWADESSPPTGATVTWSGTAGSWVCTVSFSGTRPSSMFFKFNFLQEGGVVIRNNATTDLSNGIIINKHLYLPSESGNNLIWTRQQ